MVKHSGTLDATFQALADPTRRAILATLARRESTVGELAQPFRVSAPAITKHLKILERAGLMERRKDGRIHHCRLVAKPLKDAEAWLADYRQFWEQQFDALADYLSSSERSKEERE